MKTGKRLLFTTKRDLWQFFCFSRIRLHGLIACIILSLRHTCAHRSISQFFTLRPSVSDIPSDRVIRGAMNLLKIHDGGKRGNNPGKEKWKKIRAHGKDRTTFCVQSAPLQCFRNTFGTHLTTVTSDRHAADGSADDFFYEFFFVTIRNVTRVRLLYILYICLCFLQTGTFCLFVFARRFGTFSRRRVFGHS